MMLGLFGLSLVGLKLAGCVSLTKMIDSGTIKLGMSEQDFETKMLKSNYIIDKVCRNLIGGTNG